MSQTQASNVTYAMVAKAISRQATTIQDPSSATYIDEGEIVVTDLNNNVLTTATTLAGLEKVQIAQLKGSELLYKSPVLEASKITKYQANVYAAATDKVVYVGYNGTSGDLEADVLVPGTEYIIKVRKLGINDHLTDSCLTHKLITYYNETATSGREVLGRGLVKNGVLNFTDIRNVDNFIKIEWVSASASTALAVGTATATYGSKTVIASSASHGVVAGDYLRFGSTTTDAVYYVSAVSGTTITLEIPYQGTSGSSTPETLDTPTTSAMGLKFTGTEKKFKLGYLWYDVSNFDITLKNFDNTDITVSANASLGNGTYKEVAELEWETQDYEGQTSHVDHLMPERNLYAASGTNYDLVIIKGYDDSVDQVSGTPKSKFTIFLAFPDGNDQADAAGSATVAMGVLTALDGWLTANTSATYTEASKV